MTPENIVKLLRSGDATQETAEEAAAIIERLQGIIDSRPAINQGLFETYPKWSQSIYADEMHQALISAGIKITSH